MAEEDKLTVSKLEGSKNWQVWKYQMQTVLEAKDLWGHVDGTKTRPEDAGQQPAFDRSERKTKALLVTSINSDLVYLITECTTSKQIWDKLKERFQRDTIASKLFLKQKFFSLKMKDDDSIEEHLRHMKEITDQLAAINAPIPEDEHIVAILLSLPRTYNTIVTALTAKGDELHLAQVQQALINEEEKRLQSKASKSTTTGSDRGESALRHEKFHRKPIRCYECNQEGHISRNCRQKNGQKGYKPKGAWKPGKHKAAPAETACPEEDNEPSDNAFATGLVTASKEENKWIVDSGASQHMTSSHQLFVDYEEFTEPEPVTLGDGHTVNALGKGNIKIIMMPGTNGEVRGTLKEVLYVPKLACNLFSVRAAASNGLVVQIGHSMCWIKNSSGKVVGRGRLFGKMYQLDCQVNKPAGHASVATDSSNKLDLWHQRMAHLNIGHIKTMLSKDLTTGIDASTCKGGNLNFCEPCAESKAHRKPFKSAGAIQSTQRLELIHSDVAGPMKTESLGGAKYFVTFIDDYSRCVAVYPMKQKSETLSKFKKFEALVTNETGLTIKTLRTDNGGEYMSKEFQDLLQEKGIRHETTVPYSPEQNGVAERFNRTLEEAALSMILQAKLSKIYWAEAVCTAAYVRNRVITTATGCTPYERWYGKKPDISHLRVFGCMAYAHVADVNRQKMDAKATKMRLVGYSLTQKGYRLYDETRQKIYIRRDVTFNESDFGHTPNQLDILEKPEVTGSIKEETSKTESNEQQEVRRSSRDRKPPTFYHDEYAAMSKAKYTALHVAQIEEPSTLEEALNSEYSSEWKSAADAEYQSLIENDTWEMVELPPGHKAIDCKWVFRVKHDENGQIERFKGRLVAKGFQQKYGIDYVETFSPVVRFSSIRALLAFAVSKGMLIHQMDVVTAFLNGHLDEEIYMKQPEGYVKPGTENMVCHLKKSLYGLKQSSRCWNKAFQDFMLSQQFKQSDADPCIFIRKLDGQLTVVAVYVDDLILLADSADEMENIKANLSNQFKMKDMGELHYCLGVNITRKENALHISQEQYINSILEKYNMANANPVSTPMDINVKLEKDDSYSKPVDTVLYQSMIGSLLYAAIATRPDIAHAVGALARFNSAPNETHLTAVKRVFRYLKGTANLHLQYTAVNLNIEGYSDADWASNADDRRSTTGNVFMMSEGAISWLSQRQPTVALSTTEAEYIALCSATQEAIWLQRLMKDLKIDSSGPMIINEDNQGAIAMSKNPVGHKRTKHIDIKYHFVREKIQEKILELKYCPTKEMLADIFTKQLPRGQFEYLRSKLGLK